MVTRITRDAEKSRLDRVELVTIMTVDRTKPPENQGFGCANAPKSVYLLIPSCESRARPGLPSRPVRSVSDLGTRIALGMGIEGEYPTLAEAVVMESS